MDKYMVFHEALRNLLDYEHGERDEHWKDAFERIMLKVEKELDALEAIRKMQEIAT